MRSVGVHVLVGSDYLLTVHEERAALPVLLAPRLPEGRSRQYIVYAVLEAMIASAFDALNEVEETLDELAVMSADLRGGRLRMATLRAITARLARMRREIGPQRTLFERVGVEIERLPGLEADDERYFDRLADQVDRLVAAIEAASDTMTTLVDLQAQRDVLLADRGGDDLPAADVRHRVLRHELQLDGRSGRHPAGVPAARCRRVRGSRCCWSGACWCVRCPSRPSAHDRAAPTIGGSAPRRGPQAAPSRRP